MIKSNFAPKQLIIFFIYLFLLLSSFLLQTSFWYQLFGYWPAPCLWMPFFVYLMMSREFPKNILWFGLIYLLFLSNSIAVPVCLLISLASTFFIIHFLQQRFSTLSIFDLVLFSSGAILVFPFLYALVFYFLYNDFQWDWLSSLGSLALSAPLIPGLLMICRRVDTAFNPRAHEEGLVIDL